MEVDLGPGHNVLDGVPAIRERGTASPVFSAHVYIVAKVAHLSYCWALVRSKCTECHYTQHLTAKQP